MDLATSGPAAVQETPTNSGERLLDSFVSWLWTTPGRIVLSLAIILVGWYLSKLVVQAVARPVSRRFTRPSVIQTVLRGIRAAVVLFSLAIAAGLIGFQPGDILLSVTVLSAVIGLILAPIIGSVLNGLFVLADRPYEIGDMIELVDEAELGYVEDITLRYTKIFTLDNTFIVIPNSNIQDRDVVNYSAEDERTRLTLDVDVTYEGDLEEARDIVESAAQSVDSVISGGPDIRIGSVRYPSAPTCYISEYGDHGVRLRLRYWAKQPYKLLSVRSQVQERIWERLADADVEIAYPHSHLVFDDTSGEMQVAVRDGDAREVGERSRTRAGGASGDGPRVENEDRGRSVERDDAERSVEDRADED